MQDSYTQNMINDLLQIIILFVLPVALLYFGIIPIKYRMLALCSVMVLILSVVAEERWTLKDLGISIDGISQAMIAYTIFTVIGIYAISAFAKFLNRKPPNISWKNEYFPILLVHIAISVLQEFGFRGFLMLKLEAIFISPTIVILVNALLFSFSHIIYPNKKVVLSATFVGGLGFAGIYYLFPNLILVSVSHVILNFFFILRYQFLSPQKVERLASE